VSRVVGIDYGTKRVGVALSDESRMIASPYRVIEAAAAIEMIEQIVAGEDIELVVVGLPIGLAGNETPSTIGAREFAEELSERLAVTVELADERFTSKVAEDVLIEAGMTRERRRQIRDKMAATVMLQSYLDSLR
jgi:putative Holliday junction resolvase